MNEPFVLHSDLSGGPNNEESRRMGRGCCDSGISPGDPWDGVDAQRLRGGHDSALHPLSGGGDPEGPPRVHPPGVPVPLTLAPSESLGFAVAGGGTVTVTFATAAAVTLTYTPDVEPLPEPVAVPQSDGDSGPERRE